MSTHINKANGILAELKGCDFYPQKHCAICYDKMDEKAYITPCGHYYCCECLDEWKENKKYFIKFKNKIKINIMW